MIPATWRGVPSLNDSHWNEVISEEEPQQRKSMRLSTNRNHRIKKKKSVAEFFLKNTKIQQQNEKSWKSENHSESPAKGTIKNNEYNTTYIISSNKKK